MKDYSVTQIKRGLKVSLNQLPQEGSRIRELYDLFTEFKGHIIDFGKNINRTKDSEGYKIYMAIRQLDSSYGMIIRHLGKGKYVFAGEYIGAKYVNYENKYPLHIKVKPGRTNEGN